MNERNKLEIQFLKRAMAIRNSSGFHALLELNTIRTTYFIFSENYRIYLKTLKHYYLDQSNILNNSVKRWHRQKIVIKDIHNLISSTISYVDHINNSNCSNNVKEEIEKIKNKPLYNFIRALRNFLIHREPLYLSSRIENHTIETGEISSLQYESFNKQTFEAYLEEKSENTKKSNDRMALNYLKTLPENINLNLVFNELKDLISTFHFWFVLNYVKTNRESLKAILTEVDSLHDEAIKNKLKKMYPITHGQYRHLKCLLFRAEKTIM